MVGEISIFFAFEVKSDQVQKRGVADTTAFSPLFFFFSFLFFIFFLSFMIVLFFFSLFIAS